MNHNEINNDLGFKLTSSQDSLPASTERQSNPSAVNGYNWSIGHNSKLDEKIKQLKSHLKVETIIITKFSGEVRLYSKKGENKCEINSESALSSELSHLVNDIKKLVLESNLFPENAEVNTALPLSKLQEKNQTETERLIKSSLPSVSQTEKQKQISLRFINELSNKKSVSNKKSITEKISEKITQKYYSVLNFFKLENNSKQALNVLTSESTADGAWPRYVKSHILKSLPSNIDPKLRKEYENYTKNKSESLNSLKEGDRILLDLEVPGHHITGMIKKTGGEYSLTVANSGAGLTNNPISESDGKHYTVFTYKGLSKEKLESFLNSTKNLWLQASLEKGITKLYQEIEKLNGDLDSENSHVDNEQLGGSCCARQELLMIKHMIGKESYHQLKINLSEKAILSQAKIFNNNAMSANKKIIFLDSVQRLKKRYQKAGMEAGEKLMQETEQKILASLENSEKSQKSSKFFGKIRKTPDGAGKEYKALIDGLKCLQKGNLIQARQLLKRVAEQCKELPYPFKADTTDDQEAVKILNDAVSNLIKLKLSTVSLEEWDLLGGVYVILNSVSSTEKIQGFLKETHFKEKVQQFYEKLEFKMERHFIIKSDWGSMTAKAFKNKIAANIATKRVKFFGELRPPMEEEGIECKNFIRGLKKLQEGDFKESKKLLQQVASQCTTNPPFQADIEKEGKFVYFLECVVSNLSKMQFTNLKPEELNLLGDVYAILDKVALYKNKGKFSNRFYIQHADWQKNFQKAKNQTL